MCHPLGSSSVINGNVLRFSKWTRILATFMTILFIKSVEAGYVFWVNFPWTMTDENKLHLCLLITYLRRMHSSRMRTAHALTVRGCAWEGACMVVGGMCGRGVCHVTYHAFDVTCMLSPHQLRASNSAVAYILVGHVTCKACWDTHPALPTPCEQNDKGL